ncbi:MAG: carboxypeptidase regulatory-like domain-containing protein [Acidobacteriota bacterium]|jgi:plastocyanin
MNSNSSFYRVLLGGVGALAVAALLVAGCAPAEEAPAPEGGGETAAAGGEEEMAAEAPQDPEAGSNAIEALQQGSATISGTITYVGQVPSFQPINMDADPVCAEKHDEPVYPETLVLGDGNTVANIFVQVKDTFAQEDYPAPSAPVVVDQRGCLYHPHVVGVLAGQPLQFWNSDAILHNVHGTPSANREFNLGMPATLKEKSVTLNTPEEFVPVKCDVHPWMSAYVAVMTHPYFDVTTDDGRYEITVPPGTYTVEAWHERLGTRTSEVTVADGETASVDFELDVPQQ